MYDAIVIGGGPGGSSAGSYLAMQGRRVLLLEREHFPRFHVGESLLPYCQELFRELGVLEELSKVGYPRKYGAQFHLSSGNKHLKLVFSDGRFTRETETFQVERSSFDEILLNNARRKGVEVREGWTVRSFQNGADGVSVEAADANGQAQTFNARYLIDASGRANVTGNIEGLRQVHRDFRKIALFGHYEGVMRDEGTKGGDTVIVRMANKWFWLIPISATKVSVGLVMDSDEFASLGRPAQKLFDELAAKSRVMSEWMKEAKLIGKFHTTADFSYFNKRLVGPRLLRVGDAAGFMDPIFSAGVYLAMYSGKMASDVVHTAIDQPQGAERRFAHYEKHVFGAMRFYWEMVQQYYTKPFMELFLEPRGRFSIPAAVNAALAGELSGRWAIRWRMRLFFWLVWTHARRPIVPSVRFE